MILFKKLLATNRMKKSELINVDFERDDSNTYKNIFVERFIAIFLHSKIWYKKFDCLGESIFVMVLENDRFKPE